MVIVVGKCPHTFDQWRYGSPSAHLRNSQSGTPVPHTLALDCPGQLRLTTTTIVALKHENGRASIKLAASARLHR